MSDATYMLRYALTRAGMHAADVSGTASGETVVVRLDAADAEHLAERVLRTVPLPATS